MNRIFARTSTGTIGPSDGAPTSGVLHSVFATDTVGGTARVQDASGGIDFTFLIPAGTVQLVFAGLAYSGLLTVTLTGTAPKAYLELGA